MVVAFFCMWDSYRKSKRLPLYNDPKRTNWNARLCHFFIASAQLIHCLVKCYSVVYFVSVCWESRRVITLQHSTNTAFGLFVSCFIHSIHIAHLSRCYFFLICWVFVLCVCVCVTAITVAAVASLLRLHLHHRRRRRRWYCFLLTSTISPMKNFHCSKHYRIGRTTYSIWRKRDGIEEEEMNVILSISLGAF